MDRQVSRLAFEEIEAGMTFKASRRFSIEDVMAFAEMSGDFSPLHVDADYAAGTEFGSRVIHGMLLASLFSRLVGMKIPGESALYVGQDLAFRRPVLVGETVTAIAKVTGKTEATRTLVLATEIRNEKDEIVVSGSAKVKVREDIDEARHSTVERPSRSSLSESRTVLVTGASRGVGAGIARLLGKKGYAVVVNYYNSRPQAMTVVEDITNAGGKAIAIQADIRDRDAVDQMVGEISTEIGRLDCVVNGAIGEIHMTQFSDLTWQDFQEILEYQLKGVINVCQASYAHLQQGAHSSIVNILSQVTNGVPPSQMADYVAGKYALLGLSKAMAAEWAGDKIRVNTVSPGMIQTDLTLHYHERVFKMEAARTPMKRIATVDDVAECVAFLLSEQSTFITGTDTSLTGGQVMG